MSITVRNILSLPSFQNAVVLAGGESLENEVLQVSIADSPLSDVDYVVSKKGDFYLSGFYFAKDSLESMYGFLRALKDTNASGLCLTDEYVKEFPDEIVAYCNAIEIPVLLVSVDIPYSTMIKEIMELIIFDGQNALLTNKISSLISGTLDAQHKLLILKEINPHFQNYITAVYIPFPADAYNHISNSLTNLFNQSMSSFGMVYKEALLGFITYNAFSQEVVDKKVKYYIDRISEVCPSASIGVSKYNNKLVDADTSIKQASKAAELGLTTKKNNVIYYQNLGIMKLLLLLAGRNELEEFYHEILDPIWEYDKKNHSQLFETMCIFLEQKRDYKETANILFVHENTVRYRIGKVKEMLESQNLSDDFCEAFSIALKCRNIS